MSNRRLRRYRATTPDEVVDPGDPGEFGDRAILIDPSDGAILFDPEG